MSIRFAAPAVLAAAALAGIAPTTAATKPVPFPTATPLRVIKHVYSTSRLCAGLKRSVGPAVGRVLQNDKTIAASRPLLRDFVQSSSQGSQGGRDMAVERLETLVTPLVKNTQAIENLLNDPVYNRKPQNENDKTLLQMRAQLSAVLQQQKNALDLISGFVDTENMGELKAAGHEYDNAISSPDTPGSTQNVVGATGPTASPDPLLNAGVTTAQNDPTGTLKNDPRYQTTNNALGYNPLNAFEQQMIAYQTQIALSESQATLAIMKAVPLCGGHVPASPPPPAPSATP